MYWVEQGIFGLFVAFAYIFLGLLVTGAWFTLAGETITSDHLFPWSLVTPLILFAFVIFLPMHRSRTGRFILLFLLMVFSSPLILNGASNLCRIGGYSAIADFLFGVRFWSMLVVATVGSTLDHFLSPANRRYHGI